LGGAAQDRRKSRGAAMTREAVQSRYRALRAIGTAHHSAVLKYLSRTALMQQARSIGLAHGSTLVANSEDELTLAFDLAIYTARPGRSRAIDRYARAARLTAGSDEAGVLEAMCAARFSIWQIEHQHELAGLVVRDLLRATEGWLMDDGLEASAEAGWVFAMRLCQPDAFLMTSGVVVPVDQEIMEQVAEMTSTCAFATLAEAADDPRLATAIYRVAVASGVMEGVTLE
jgi:hypothetical protein